MNIKKLMSTGWLSVLVFAVVFGFSGVAEAAVTTTQVPYRTDASNQAGWWQAIDEYNGSVYMAYNAWGGPGPANGGSTDTHTIYVAKRAPDGTWTRGCLRDGNGVCAVYPDDIGHKQPTITVDGDGYIHVFAAMHGNDWRYWRSVSPEDATNMAWRGHTMPDQNGNYTYPNATRTPNGDVYMIVRSGPRGRLYRWDNAADTWTREETFAYVPNFVVYPDDITADNAGNLHITWEWAYSAPHGIRHLGSYMRYEPSTNHFYNAAGTQMSVPVNPLSPVVYQPLEGQESSFGTGSNDPGVQSAKVDVNPTNNQPVIAYRYRTVPGGPFRVRLAEWNGSSWQRQTVYAGSYNTTAAIDVTAFGTDVRVYYAKAQTYNGDQAFSATRVGSNWIETNLLPGVRVERLSVIRSGATDHLYLAAPGTHDLYYGTSTW